MGFVPTPNQSQIFTVLRSFLVSIMPPGVSVLRGQANRVPEPQGADFIIMTPIRQRRIETNIDTYADVAFTASISGTTMTVTGILLGTILNGSQLFGLNLANGTTTISTQLTGTPGGIGTYKVSLSQTAALGVVAAGGQTFLQPSEYLIQLDVHGPNSCDNAQTISTLFRDEYCVQQFATSGLPITPLYADDPHQTPFINAESQYEDRWIVEAFLQADQVVTASQQFADILELDLVSVDAVFPPS